jgi:hypothetical protein
MDGFAMARPPIPVCDIPPPGDNGRVRTQKDAMPIDPALDDEDRSGRSGGRYRTPAQWIHNID